MNGMRLFVLVESLMCALPDEFVINIFRESLARQYKELHLDPFLFANGSVPKDVHVSEDLVPGRKLKIDVYRIRERASTSQILEFLDKHDAIHLGGLGLMLMGRQLPHGIFYIAFEEDDFDRATALRHNEDGTFQFMILKKGILWDKEDGFVCITPDPDDE